MDFVFVAAFAGEHIVNNGGTFRAKSTLAVFTKSNGGMVGMIEAVHFAVISSFLLVYYFYCAFGIAQNVVMELWPNKVELMIIIFPSGVKAVL